LARHADASGMPVAKLTPAALHALIDHPFPGNVRELENVLERAVALCEGGTIDVADLHLESSPQPRTGAHHAGEANPGSAEDTRAAGQSAGGARATATRDLASAVAETERSAILSALEATRWNRTVAARRLGLTLRQLRYRLEKLGIE